MAIAGQLDSGPLAALAIASPSRPVTATLPGLTSGQLGAVMEQPNTAVCAAHQARMVGTCKRCGSFMCALCTAPFGPTGTCSDCASRIPGGLDLERVAIRQRHVIYVLLASLVSFLLLTIGAGVLGTKGSEAAILAFAVGYWSLLVCRVVALWRLCTALEMSPLWSLLSPIGCWGLLAMLWVNSKATDRLKGAGIRVGLMGAKLPLEIAPENARPLASQRLAGVAKRI